MMMIVNDSKHHYNKHNRPFDKTTTCFTFIFFPKGPGDKECLNNKCVDLFTLDKGEECNNVNRPYFCKEGLVCGRSDSSSTGYSCQERKTKLEDNITCDDDDDDCPSDSKCVCNEITGNMQCVPLPYSDRKGLEYDNKFYEYMGCEDCDIKIAFAYYKAWCTMYEPYESDCMCLSDYPLPDESSSTKVNPASPSTSSSKTKGNSDSASAIKLSATLIIAAAVMML